MVDGRIGTENLNIYQALAEGGVGAILTGFTLVDDREKVLLPIFNLGDDAYLEDHLKLTDVVHAKGGKIFSQLVFFGSHDFKELQKTIEPGLSSYEMVAPSSFRREDLGFTPREVTLLEIKAIQEKHAQAAQRAKKAGYDGVELHGAHGFFLSQFMSPHFNCRTDAYGGSSEKRGTMALETYRMIRDAVGPDFPILMKVNVREKYPDGVILDEVVELAKKLAQEKIDGIEISGNWIDLNDKDGAIFLKEGTLIAKEAATKVILTGGIRERKQMESILNETKIEFFGLARPLMKDPNFLKHLIF
jgi:2,4-dienoyl-CoA reductase-like NADH-dependent reductase (Old Yellow Enzyme family)